MKSSEKLGTKSYLLETLENGLRLITVPMSQLESVTVMIGVGAGSRYETKKVNGLFHFLEHMAFKGTKKRSSALKIATEIDSIGGEFNAFTDKEMTAYYVKVAAKHQRLAFDLLADVLTNSLFVPAEIEKEKGVIIEEINMYKDTPSRHIGDVFLRLIYGDNPMGWETAGEKESIRQIKQKDFFCYLEQLYYPKNMAVVVAGGVKIGQIEKLAQEYFGGLKKTGQKVIKAIKIEQKKPKLKLVYKKTEQAHFCLGFPGYDLFHPDRFALAMLTTILGGGMSSRLFTEIRGKRGLAYYVECSPEFFTDSGYLAGAAGVKLEKIEEAIKVFLNEFWQLTGKKVSKKELNKAKEFNKGRLILALENPLTVVGLYTGQLLLEKKIRTLPETLKLIDGVTADDVLRVAKEVLKPESLNLALIGPYKDENKFKKVLK